MSGAWQFEQATNEPGEATGYVLPQSFSHSVVIGFIIIGNAALFAGYRKSKREGA
jgi:hypothetical protein